jgi:hypothetical protein
MAVESEAEFRRLTGLDPNPPEKSAFEKLEEKLSAEENKKHLTE